MNSSHRHMGATESHTPADIYAEILYALQRQERVMLATIIHTSGSTPSAALSKMLVTGAGTRLFGTVGGGCVEGDVVHAAKELYASNTARIMRFHLDDAHPEYGMLCGGTLDALIEPLGPEQVALVTALRTLRDAGKACVLATVLQDDGRVMGKFVLRLNEDADPAVSNSLRELVPGISAGLADCMEKAHSGQEAVRFRYSGGELIIEPMPGAPRLLIFGGGHISKSLSHIASMTGFRVTIVDDRKEFANAERFPEACRTMALPFEEAFEHVEVTPSTFIVIVTRGHRSDEQILRNAVDTPAKYIGMIGSRKKVLATFEHLMEDGVPLQKLMLVHAPVGLDIGAVTPEEIAVSIIGELVYVLRGRQKPVSLKRHGMQSLFDPVEVRND